MLNNNPRRRRGITSLTPFDLFDDAFGDFVNTAFAPLTSITSSIKVDVEENETSYVLKADIPGVEKEDIQVNLKEDVLSIDVNKEESKEENKENYILKERKTTKLSRSFYIENIQTDSIKAEYKNGVLTLILPKSVQEKENIKNININ